MLRKENRFYFVGRASCLVICLLFVSSCEAFFTYSPFSFAQRDPKDLPYKQKLEYARDALASGDSSSMEAAYKAIDDIETGDAQYLAAELSLELSGFSELVLGLLADSISLYTGSLEEIQTFLDENELQPDLLIASAGHMLNALSLGESLGPMDYVYGSLGLLLEAGRLPDGTIDLSDPPSLDLSEAQAFMALGMTEIADLPDNDPTRVFLTAFSEFIESF
jgi:hypothetical protein